MRGKGKGNNFGRTLIITGRKIEQSMGRKEGREGDHVASQVRDCTIG